MKFVVDYTYRSPGGNKVHTTRTFDCPREPTGEELMRVFTHWGQRVTCIHSVLEESMKNPVIIAVDFGGAV
jgi:hypothetical protein